MGEVYKGRDTLLDRVVAIKVSSEQFIERFEREERAVAALNHANICQIHDVGPDYVVLSTSKVTRYRDLFPKKKPYAWRSRLRDPNMNPSL